MRIIVGLKEVGKLFIINPDTFFFGGGGGGGVRAKMFSS